jgi:hypothetical protein
MAPRSVPYATYAEVPYFRKQWFFWLMWFVFSPVAIGILLTGDVYYRNGGQVRNFGLANRIVAGLIAVFWLVGLTRELVPFLPLALVLVGYVGGGLLVLYLAVRVTRAAWRHGSQADRGVSDSRPNNDSVGSTKDLS